MKKLKNEQGVTILMALLLVLTAAVGQHGHSPPRRSARAARERRPHRAAELPCRQLGGGARTRQHRPDAVYRDYHHDLRMGRGE